MVREWLAENCSKKIAEETRILYAGPITETNTENIIKLNGVDGFLLGSSSTKPVFRNIFDMVYSQAVRDFSLNSSPEKEAKD
jgi:triosephosphate isomerase